MRITCLVGIEISELLPLLPPPTNCPSMKHKYRIGCPCCELQEKHKLSKSLPYISIASSISNSWLFSSLINIHVLTDNLGPFKTDNATYTRFDSCSWLLFFFRWKKGQKITKFVVHRVRHKIRIKGECGSGMVGIFSSSPANSVIVINWDVSVQQQRISSTISCFTHIGTNGMRFDKKKEFPTLAHSHRICSLLPLVGGFLPFRRRILLSPHGIMFNVVFPAKWYACSYLK